MSSDNPRRGRQARGGKGGFSRSTTNHLPFTSLTPATDKKLVTQAVIKQSLTGGAFVDTKFYAFSRKNHSGVVDKPKAVYANSAVLRLGSKYFDDLLAGGYLEDILSSLDSSFPEGRDDFTEEYEYFSDSDLDYDEEHPPSVDTSEVVEDEDVKESLRDPTENLLSTTTTAKPQITPEEVPVNVDSEVKYTGRPGRVVVLPDVAFQTFKCLVFYLYTGEVAFAPLKSQEVEPTLLASSAYGAPLCSPKSMYRIADKYGLDDLKQKAASNIKSKLSSTNILPELFSTLTSRFEEIRTAQVTYACGTAVYDTMTANISQWITRVSTGELAHCNNVLSALVKQMADNFRTHDNLLRQTTQNLEASLIYVQKLEASSSQVQAKCTSCNRAYAPYCSNCGY